MPEEIPYGYCECGCGQKTRVSPQNYAPYGWVKGQPMRFMRGHNHSQLGEKHPSWKGGKTVHGGYSVIWQAEDGKYRQEHILNAEKAIGKKLPKKAIVHHIDGNKLNSSNNNLVICPDDAYHQNLHRRTRAYEASGHANWLKCPYCKQYDSPDNLYIRKNGKGQHRACAAKHARDQYAKKKMMQE